MRVFDPEEVEILFPVGAFFRQWGIAKARFHPSRHAVRTDAGLIHIINVLVTRD
jgi:hypothetical protein